MKEFKKAQLIAKNLPTGSYAAGCPEHFHGNGSYNDPQGPHDCRKCELAQ